MSTSEAGTWGRDGHFAVSAAGAPAAPVDASRVAALSQWLAAHSTALVGAVDDGGRVMPFPDGIALGDGHRVEERSLLELVVDEDRVPVTQAFLAALRHGVATARAHLLDRPEEAVTINYLDLRAELGVTIRTVAFGEEPGDAGTARLRSRASLELRPRLATMMKSLNGEILDVDGNAEKMLGWSASELVGRNSLDLVHPEDQARSIDNWMQMVLNRGGQSVRLRYQRGDGSWLWLESSNDPGSEDAAERVVCHMVDVSDEIAAMEALRHQERLLRQVTDTVPVGLLNLAADHSVTYANEQFLRLLRLEHLEHLGDLDVALAGDGSDLHDAIRRVLESGHDVDVELTVAGDPPSPPRRCRVDISPVLDGAEVLGALVCVVDVTQLKAEAAHDGLTGLLNRASVLECLGRELRHRGRAVGVVFVDLDDFKQVNDRLGHRAGDTALKSVAAALLGAVRRADTVGRLGGDEFLVVCPEVADGAEMDAVAQRIEAGLGGVRVAGWDKPITASVGMTLATGGTASMEDAVAAADKAMYKAKERGSTGLGRRPGATFG